MPMIITNEFHGVEPEGVESQNPVWMKYSHLLCFYCLRFSTQAKIRPHIIMISVYFRKSLTELKL